ncbi:MAG: ribokinase [Acidimicrobiales bacterium]
MIVVVGSINYDIVATGAPHHPVTGETILAAGLENHPGGKGSNQALASARAGAPTAMVGAVGDDPAGRFMVDTLARARVDTALIVTVPAPTGTALIVVADGDNTVVVVPGANALVSEPARAWSGDDVVVGQAEIPLGVTLSTMAAAHLAGATTVLNPAPAPDGEIASLDAVDVLVVNEHEVATLGGSGSVVASARRLMERGPRAVVVTLGAHGVVVVTSDTTFEVGAHDVDVVDTTGAGDCFVGNLAAALAGPDWTSRLEAAVTRANAAAALSVGRPGAGSSMPTSAEVDAFLAS